MLRSLITTEGRNARTRNERRRAGAKARRADKPHYGDFERAAGNHGRYSPPPRPFLRHERGILAEPSKPLRASPSPAEGRESYRPPSDPQGVGTRPRMTAFRSVTLPGASFTQVEGDKIHSEHTYLDGLHSLISCKKSSK